MQDEPEGRTLPETPRPLTVSVAVATYQGERWLRPQFESVLRQTRPVDQIVVSDDASTDGTVAAVRDVLRSAECEVVVLANSDRVGVSRNFERAIARVSGDIVILCDQDDEWEPQRVASVIAELTGSRVAGVFCDGIIIDDRGQPVGRTLWEAARFQPKRRARWTHDAFSDLLRGNVVTGAALAVRRHALLTALPFPPVGWHDYWIALWLTATATLAPMPQQLVRYRLHDTNAAGMAAESLAGQLAQRLDDRDVRVREHEFFSALERRLKAGAVDVSLLAALRGKVEHQRHRSTLPPSPVRRAFDVGVELLKGRYSRYSRGSLSAAFDLVHGP